VFNILLQVLDEGRLTDNKGRIADFKNSIIILTSNIGSEIIQKHFETTNDLNLSLEKSKTDVLQLLKNTMRPEFLNRIDDTVLFSPLSTVEVGKIVEMQLKGISKMLEEKGITFDATNEAINYLAEKSYQPEYGARPVKRVLQKEVLNKLSKALISNSITNESIVLLDAFDGQLVFRNPNNSLNLEN
jgi:ATP-dependent Clp protease ATP-binding subunit ClpB